MKKESSEEKKNLVDRIMSDERFKKYNEFLSSKNFSIQNVTSFL
jgi:hypothetical protein